MFNLGDHTKIVWGLQVKLVPVKPSTIVITNYLRVANVIWSTVDVSPDRMAHAPVWRLIVATQVEDDCGTGTRSPADHDIA
jgi:hypothetical protein